MTVYFTPFFLLYCKFPRGIFNFHLSSDDDLNNHIHSSSVTKLREELLCFSMTHIPADMAIKIEDQTYGLDNRGAFTVFDTAPLLNRGLIIVSYVHLIIVRNCV